MIWVEWQSVLRSGNVMRRVEKLDCETVRRYKESIIRFIFESVKGSAYEESYLISDAEEKYEEMLIYISERKAIVLGVIEDEKFAGMVWGYTYPFRDDKLRMYISILHVDESLRGQGIGGILMEQMEKEALKSGYKSLFLHAEAFNTGAIKFYERIGFQPERIQMVKRIPSINDDGIFERGVKRIFEQEAKDYYEKLTDLFMINTRAHVLTESLDRKWSAGKIMELIGYISKGQATVMGYFEKEKIVGFIWVFPHKYCGEERNILNAITVFPEYRSRHVAEKLFQSMEYELRHDRKAIYTFVDAANVGGYKFYLKQGMTEERYQLVKRVC